MDILRIGALTALMAGIAACAPSSNDSPEPAADDVLGPGEVVIVNGERVPESVFRLLGLRTLQKSAEQMTEQERSELIDQLINMHVLASAGLADDIDRARTVAAELELLRLQTLANATITRYIEDNPPTETELRAVYEQQMQNLEGTEYSARHILVQTREEAENVIDLLDQGEDFAALAREYSTGPTGPDGGQLDWFTPNGMVEPFGDAVRAMDVGTYTAEPVQTQYGWHVIYLEETREQQPPGLESMRDEITVLAERRKIQNYINSLREAAVVEAVD